MSSLRGEECARKRRSRRCRGVLASGLSLGRGARWVGALAGSEGSTWTDYQRPRASPTRDVTCIPHPLGRRAWLVTGAYLVIHAHLERALR